MITQALLDKLRARQPAFGFVLTLDAPGILDIVGAGWDFIWVDMQHGYITEERLKHILRTCDLVGVSGLVRPPGQNRQLISRILDWDAAGVIVPQVHTPEQAAEILRAARFPPLGDRSYGGPRVLFRNGPDYCRRANERQLVTVQIESPEAVANAEALAGLDGVDALMLGPNDLELRIGAPIGADLSHPQLARAATAVGAACEQHGKAGMAIARSEDQIGRYLDLGFRLIVVGADSVFLRQGRDAARQIIERF